VKADLALPNVLPDTAGEADVRIYQADALDTPHASAFGFDIPGLAEFNIQQGHTITYKPYNNASENDVCLSLMGSCMGALLQQRGLVVLHGNAITHDNKTCTVFVGDSGAGKSTLAARHYLQGATILADDVCAITLNAAGKPVVFPSYPQVKLWQESADLLGIPTDKLERVRTQYDKFRLPVHDRFARAPCVVEQVVELHAEEPAVTTCVRGVQKVLKLQHHSYRYYFLEKMGREAAYIQQLMHLAHHIEFNQMSRCEASYFE
jgi:hypothetical protein